MRIVEALVNVAYSTTMMFIKLLRVCRYLDIPVAFCFKVDDYKGCVGKCILVDDGCSIRIKLRLHILTTLLHEIMHVIVYSEYGDIDNDVMETLALLGAHRYLCSTSSSFHIMEAKRHFTVFELSDQEIESLHEEYEEDVEYMCDLLNQLMEVCTIAQ